MKTPIRWDVEDVAFWNATGKQIAYRNLWVSIPNLLCGFAIWLLWSTIIVRMQTLHDANPAWFAFTSADGQPLGGNDYRVALVPIARGRRSGGSDLVHSQFVHGRDFGRTQRESHDDAAADATGLGDRPGAARSPDILHNIYRVGCSVRSRWRCLRFVDVQHQLLFPAAGSGVSAGIECRAGQPGRERDAVHGALCNLLRALRFAWGRPLLECYGPPSGSRTPDLSGYRSSPHA